MIVTSSATAIGPRRAARRAARARAGRPAGARGVRRGRGGRVRGLPPGQGAGVRHHARARTAVDRHRRRRRPADRALGPRERGGAGAGRAAAAADGRDRRARAGRVRAGRRRRDRRHRLRAGSVLVRCRSRSSSSGRRSSPRTRGALRLSVVARICEEVAALHATGVDVVVVTSGAIARGIHLLGLGGRPRAVEELQAASRRRPGPAVPHLRRVPARARHPVRPGAADVLRHERAHALPQRAPHAAQARRVADRAGHQRERHDHDRRDLLRRQRLPGRAGGGAGRRVAAVAADLDRRGC